MTLRHPLLRGSYAIRTVWRLCLAHKTRRRTHLRLPPLQRELAL